MKSRTLIDSQRPNAGFDKGANDRLAGFLHGDGLARRVRRHGQHRVGKLSHEGVVVGIAVRRRLDQRLSSDGADPIFFQKRRNIVEAGFLGFKRLMQKVEQSYQGSAAELDAPRRVFRALRWRADGSDRQRWRASAPPLLSSCAAIVAN